jgi:hypothetical protein
VRGRRRSGVTGGTADPEARDAAGTPSEPFTSVAPLAAYVAARQTTVEAEQAVADLVVDGPVTLPIVAALKAAATPRDVGA